MDGWIDGMTNEWLGEDISSVSFQQRKILR